MRYQAVLVGLLLLGVAFCSMPASGADTITLSGHVQHVDGSPFAGATVTFFDVDRSISLSSTTDANGDFTRPLTDGNYLVTASYALHRSNISYTVHGTSASDLNFTLWEVQGTVIGHVYGSLTSLPGVKVTLSNSTASFSSYSSSPDGGFIIENITAGTYIAKAEKDGYQTGVYPDPVVVTRDQVIEINFTIILLSDNPAQLTGRATYDGDPLSGVRVVLSPKDGADIVVTTDANGYYNFTKVTPGQYDLLMTKSGYIGSTQKVVLGESEQKNLDVAMKKDTLPGTAGFLMDYDLAHSLMIVALGFALVTTLTALVIRYRAGSKPEILEKEDQE